MSLTESKKARTAQARASGAAAGANAARGRTQDAANVARARAQDAADVAKSRAQDAADVALSVARDAADLALDRAKDAAAQVVPLSKRVSATAAQSVEQGVHDARGWAAPRFEDAATAVSETVAPKVSAALKATAKKVDPTPSKPRRLLGWPGAVGLAILLAAGTGVAVVLRQRPRATAALPR